MSLARRLRQVKERPRKGGNEDEEKDIYLQPFPWGCGREQRKGGGVLPEGVRRRASSHCAASAVSAVFE